MTQRAMLLSGLSSRLTRTIPGTGMMPRQFAIDASPPINRGMKDSLNRDAFRKSIPILAARVSPNKTGTVLKSPVMKKFVRNSAVALY
jgi:hypothetical protein